MSSEISWVLELDVREGRERDFETLVADMVEATRANEPDTLDYVWNTSADGRKCHIYERYADSEAVLTHLGNFGAHFAPRFLDIMQPTRLVVYGSPNAAAREALGGLGATYLEPRAGFRREAERAARYAPA